MSISKGNVILASDVNTKNASLKAIDTDGKPDKTLGNDSQDWWFNNKWFRNNVAGNLYWYHKDDSGGQYKLMMYSDAAHNDLIFRWDGDDSSPHTNTLGWGYSYQFDTGSSPYTHRYRVNVPKDTNTWFKIDYDDEPFLGRPERWYLEARQAQSDIAIGDHIRVWNTGWTSLKTEESTIITAALANTGYLGAE